MPNASLSRAWKTRGIAYGSSGYCNGIRPWPKCLALRQTPSLRAYGDQLRAECEHLAATDKITALTALRGS